LATSNYKSNAYEVINFLNVSLCVACLLIVKSLPYETSTLLPVAYAMVCLGMIHLFLKLKQDYAINNLDSKKE